jgi:DNA-binding beta-propeller fold protein YncE
VAHGIKLTASIAAAGVLLTSVASAQVMVVGIDRKFAYDASAVRQALQPGNDELLFFDVKRAEDPRLIGALKLENSIIGPPTNIAVTPDQSIALIANAVHSEQAEAGWKAVPADEVFVVDLKASPPKLTQTLKVGRQPSGIAVSPDGRFALVANRDSNSITTLTIHGSTVAVGDTVSTRDSISAIAITPDGKRAIATKTLAHKVVLLDLAKDGKVPLERIYGSGSSRGTWRLLLTDAAPSSTTSATPANRTATPRPSA